MRRVLCLMILTLLVLSVLNRAFAAEPVDPEDPSQAETETEQEEEVAEDDPPGEEIVLEVDLGGENAYLILSDASISSSYGVGTSYIDIFGGIASKLDYGVHYVYWREGQNQYCFAYSDTLALSGTRFTANSAEVITYTTTSGYNSQPTFTTETDTNFNLSANSYLVWSDLGDYPALYEREGRDYAQTACVILCSFGLYYLFKHLWDSVRQRFLDH